MRAMRVLLLSLMLVPAVHAGYRETIGYHTFTNTLAELGISVPTGAGLSMSHVEAETQSGHFVPDTNHVEFVGKTFEIVSPGSSTSSTHATTVGRTLYGADASMTPDIDHIKVYSALDWVNNFLNFGTSSAPSVETQSIQNHSWAGAGGNEAQNRDILRRLDYQVARDQTIVVVGITDNAGGNAPNLLSHAYNVITVGRLSGNHAYGGTTFDEAGRRKPDLVAPPNLGPQTSFAVPVVSTAAGVLLDLAQSHTALNSATNAVAIKSILMAGADKTTLSGWSQTESQPLDTVYGAGVDNINNSGLILLAGQQPASDTSVVQARGWDIDTIAASATKLYFFDVPENQHLAEFSASLNWNRVITDGVSNPNQWGDPQAYVADLRLGLFAVENGFTLGDPIFISDSSVDNVEYIYQQSLLTGRYALQVVGGSQSTEYALSWTGEMIPEPSALILSLFGGLLFYLRRRRIR